MEVAGLVVPLLISTARLFCDIGRKVKKYRSFSEEAKCFQIKLSTQRILYRGECQKLLEKLVGREKAESWLQESDRQQGLPETCGLDLNAFSTRDTEVLQGIMEISELIQSKLRAIEAKAKSVVRAAAQENVRDKSSLLHSSWHQRVVSKISFVFSESQLGKNLEEIRHLIQDFISLMAKLSSLSQNSLLTSSSSVALDEKPMREVQMVQKASLCLYEAFCSACKSHVHHRANFPLEIEGSGLSSRLFRSTLAFRHDEHQSSEWSERFTWMTVESVLTDPSNESKQPSGHAFLGDFQLPETSASRSRKPPDSQRLKVNHVHFDVPLRSPSPDRALIPAQLDLTDFCRQQNFCSQIRSYCSRKSVVNTNKCIGYMRATPDCDHFVYLTEPKSYFRTDQSMSLASLFDELSKRSRSGGLIPYERLRLASLLAKAFLLFSHTPWLGPALKSQDIFFYDLEIPVDPLLELPRMTTPYVNSSVSPSNSYNSPRQSHILGQNSRTINLGVLLLELAFQDKIENLQPSRANDGQFSLTSTAHHLALRVGRELGGRYGEIVRKCLVGASGMGYDLNNPTAQLEFHRDVITKLERLEEGLRKFQLDE